MSEASTASLVRCEISEGVARITLDDGDKNLLSPDMLAQINAALDRAERADAIVILSASGDVFSAGFDLRILKTGVLQAFTMLIGGFRLSQRLLGFPRPVIIACNGHAMAMGAFLLLSADYRIGIDRPVKIAANEVAIGLTMPHSAIAICRQRLPKPYYDRAIVLSEQFSDSAAVAAGFLDETVAPELLQAAADARAADYAQLDRRAHRESKMRMRHETVRDLGRAIRADQRQFVWMGIKRALGIR